MDKLKKLEEEIKLLEKEKEKELLRIEVEKLKKTQIEETTIIKRIIEKYEPAYVPWPTSPLITWCGSTGNQCVNPNVTI